MKINISISAVVAFTKGQRVIVKIKKDEWYAGSIKTVGRTGGYTIQFNDGDVVKVDPAYIKTIKGVTKVGKKTAYSDLDARALMLPTKPATVTKLQTNPVSSTKPSTRPVRPASNVVPISTTVQPNTSVKKTSAVYDPLDSLVAKFVTNPVNRKKIKNLGGGNVDVTSGRANTWFFFYVPILDSHGKDAVNENGSWRFAIRARIEFKKSGGTWKLVECRGEAGLTPPVPVGRYMSDEAAVEFITKIFNIPTVKLVAAKPSGQETTVRSGYLYTIKNAVSQASVNGGSRNRELSRYLADQGFPTNWTELKALTADVDISTEKLKTIANYCSEILKNL